MKLVYTMVKGHKPDKKDVKTCDEAAKAMKTLLLETAKVAGWWLIPYCWVAGQVYIRTILEDKIEYNFFMLP